MRAVLIAAFVGLCSVTLAYSEEAGRTDGQVLRPDSSMQSLIREAAQARREDDAAGTAKAKLAEIVRKSPELLARQLVYASLNATTEREAWAILGLMKYLAQWDTEMRRGLIPLLEARDERVKREATGWLAAIDSKARPRIDDTDVAFYREELLRAKLAPPAGLVAYIYDRSPSKALVLLGDIYSSDVPFEPPRSLVWADHLIQTFKWRARHRFLQDGDLDQARKEIRQLAQHEGWYARRYAVEVLRQAPIFGTPDIVERLRNDAHPLVQEPAKGLK